MVAFGRLEPTFGFAKVSRKAALSLGFGFGSARAACIGQNTPTLGHIWLALSLPETKPLPPLSEHKRQHRVALDLLGAAFGASFGALERAPSRPTRVGTKANVFSVGEHLISLERALFAVADHLLVASAGQRDFTHQLAALSGCR